MKKGEIAIGKIEKTNFPSNGFIQCEDGNIEIKNAIPGQEVEYIITRKKNGFAKGRVLRIVNPSPIETNPNLCQYHGECGGCLYQSIPYEKQLQLKEKQMQELLQMAVEKEFIWEGILPSPIVYGYRNKMEYSFGDAYRNGPLALGMHKRGSHYDIISTMECNIVHSDFNKILENTLEFFTKKRVEYYHKVKHQGFLRHLIIRRSIYTKQILINLVTSSQLDIVERDILLNEWRNLLLNLSGTGEIEAKIEGILHTKNDALADAVINEGITILYGKDYIKEKLWGLEFKITSFSFFQTNSLGAEILYKKTGEYIGDTKGKSVYDLYSGTGTIAQLLAKVADRVYGIEIIEEAVKSARENAILNGIYNCTFIAGDVLKVVESLEKKPDIIILDPPRDGVHPKALPKIINFGAEKIIYISCKPSSLARDLPILQEGGYQLEKACAVDMFPHTPNVEMVALLSKPE